MFKSLHGVAAAAALAVIMPVAHAEMIPSLEVSTTQQGANTTIDQETMKTWNFTVLPGFLFADILGSFVIKEGQGTTEPIQFALYAGSDASGAQLASTSVAAGTVGQSFTKNNPVEFLLENVFVGPGQYSLKLFSNALNSGNDNWFFKGTGDNLICSTDVGIDCSGNGNPDPVPEPGSLALLALGLLGLRATRQRLAA